MSWGDKEIHCALPLEASSSRGETGRQSKLDDEEKHRERRDTSIEKLLGESVKRLPETLYMLAKR